MFRICVAGVLFAGLMVVVVCFSLRSWGEASQNLNSQHVVNFERATSLKKLSKQLVQEDVIDSEFMFYAWVRLFSNYAKFQAGKYVFEGSLTPKNIAQKFIEGDVYQEVLLQFTIPEGFTLIKLIERLSALGVDSTKNLTTLVNNKNFLKLLKIPASSLEGYLYPATYSFYEKPTGKIVFEKISKTFWDKLPAQYAENVKAKGLSLNQAVAFASLVEMETFHNDEMPLVAEVIWRRLKNNEPLGIDAAVIYGMKNYTGNISAKDLKNAKNPYNTRIHRGLPPTPIGSPSTSALLSVLSPSNQGYYFFVVNPHEPTRHRFSKTLKEHNAYVKELVYYTKRGVKINDVPAKDEFRSMTRPKINK